MNDILEEANNFIKLYRKRHKYTTKDSIENAIICVEQIKNSWYINGNDKFDQGLINWYEQILHELHNSLEHEIQLINKIKNEKV